MIRKPGSDKGPGFSIFTGGCVWGCQRFCKGEVCICQVEVYMPEVEVYACSIKAGREYSCILARLLLREVESNIVRVYDYLCKRSNFIGCMFHQALLWFR